MIKSVKRVAILSCGSGNINSLINAFEAVGATCKAASARSDIVGADALVFPGIGHFGAVVKALAERDGLLDTALELIDRGIPTLGICLGFHLLTRSSEEEPGRAGLNLLPLLTLRLRPSNTKLYKVPHIGWNSINSIMGSSLLLSDIPTEKQKFYFANSYAVHQDPQRMASVATYRHEFDYVAIYEQKSIFGVQFHPEKSKDQGLTVLRNFLQA